MRSISRRTFLKVAGIAGAGAALGGYALAALRDEFPVDPYISQADHLDSLPAPLLSFYKQPWRGYLETVPATQFLAGIGMNYSLPPETDHESVIALLADTGIRHIRVELGWSEVLWDESALEDSAYYSSVFAACRKHQITPLILLNAHHGVPGPHLSEERVAVRGGKAGARSLVLDSVDGFRAGRTGISNLTDYRMCEVLFTDVDRAARTVKLSRPLPKDLAAGAKVAVDTLKYLPLHPVGTPELAETLSGWRRYVQLALQSVSANGLKDFEVEIWNELVFGSAFLSINNYYEPARVADEREVLHEGGPAWELGRQTANQVKSQHPAARVIWGFSNTDFYHTAISDLPPGVDGQSYHPYGTNRQQIPRDFPPKDQHKLVIEKFIPHLSWCMPEGYAHLGTTIEQLIRGQLRPDLRTTNVPPGSSSFSHYMTEHGFVAHEAGITKKEATQAYKAKAMLRALTFWLNKGISRMDIYTVYEAKDSETGILWSEPGPASYGRGGQPSRSPALAALKNLTRQFQGAEALTERRSLQFKVTALHRQPVVFEGGWGHRPLYYREMLTLLPFQVTPHRFVVAAYVMSYDITRPPPPMKFRLRIEGVEGSAAKVGFYDPIRDSALPLQEDARDGRSITVTLEQVEYPRLITLDEA